MLPGRQALNFAAFLRLSELAGIRHDRATRRAVTWTWRAGRRGSAGRRAAGCGWKITYEAARSVDRYPRPREASAGRPEMWLG